MAGGSIGFHDSTNESPVLPKNPRQRHGGTDFNSIPAVHHTQSSGRSLPILATTRTGALSKRRVPTQKPKKSPSTFKTHLEADAQGSSSCLTQPSLLAMAAEPLCKPHS